jgi:hypothetical protein
MCEFPGNWRGLFGGRCYAVKGDTPQILAALAGNSYWDEVVEDVSEFRHHLIKSFGNLNRRERLLGLVSFANQIMRGDIALSILDEFEPEDLKVDTRKSKQTDLENRMILATCDSIELDNRREVDAVQFSAEYEREVEVYFRYCDAKWALAVGRARAIAVSRNPLASDTRTEAIEILRTEVLEILDSVVPYEQMTSLTRRLCPQVVREWMLAYESLGIFYMEDGNGSRAVECFDKAKSICSDRDDLWRISRARHIAGTQIQGHSILTAEERDLMKELLSEL